MTYRSITDLLTAHSYVALVDREGYYFYKGGHRIRAEDLAGHTVESFAQKYGLEQQEATPNSSEFLQGEALSEPVPLDPSPGALFSSYDANFIEAREKILKLTRLCPHQNKD
jgi:hypothetical protein